MLWTGGALSVKDTVIARYASQTDLPATLLNQMNLPAEEFIFSKDALSPCSKSFAYYTYNDGIGFVSDSIYTIYSLVTDKFLFREIPAPEGSVDPALAYTQYLLLDFNRK